MAKHTFRVDLEADGLGLTLDGKTRRLDFPQVHLEHLDGSSGGFVYQAREIVLDAISARLDRVQWSATAASLGNLTLRSPDGNLTLVLHRVEFPRGLQITRAERGVELAAQHITIADASFTVEDVTKLRGGFAGGPAPATPSAEPDSAPVAAPPGSASASASSRFRAVTQTDGSGPLGQSAGDSATMPASSSSTSLPAVTDEPTPLPLRQRYFRFLDSLSGKLDIDLFVDIDLPVISSRKATHALRIPIRDGSFDFKQLSDQLQGIEGRLIEFERSGDRLVLGWALPLMATRELISWQLDDDAMTMAVFDRLPLRCLVDWRTRGDRGRKKGLVTLKALALRKIALQVAMTAPARLDVGEALIQIGDEESPGLLDVNLSGDIVQSGADVTTPTALTGTVGLLDATIKDLDLGGVTITTDRIHLGGIENLRLEFAGVRPGRLSGVVSRVAATNVRLVIE